ncbi:glycosyltransferase family 2 protein [Paenibacillus agricola]|uniref:Glycosyltransferase family 2 protein n=1 Tax=Paenibacillus agricola TaxID=2716264 RepID=A0ABX0JK29_9BACL|nr:glycosyltransferase family 2 protein [Paenibacillus agricola]NHN34331.1 glycosyltransferase family 2 protein [Paenibacillus agricola]
MSFSIIIPAYNESKSISKVLDMLTHLTTNKVEIIVVDDCSTDNTVEIVRSFPNVRLLQHRHNQGCIKAIGTGIKAASYDVVVSFDADGQHPVESLQQIVDPILQNKADVVLGVRGSLPRLGERIIAVFSGVTDATTGFRAMKKELVHLFEDDLAYGGMFIIKAKRIGARIIEVPITVHDRIAGYSVHSNYNILKKSLKFALWSFIGVK